jgi:hypothetical protein
MFHHNRRITCGLAFSHAVHKASTALLTAVKLLPFPSSVKSQSRDRDNKKGLFSRSFWKKLSRRELNVDVGEKERRTDDREEEIQRCRSFAEFLQESQDQLSDQIYYISPTDLFSGEATLSKDAVGDSSSFSSEDSEVTQSSSGVIVVMMSGDCVGSHVSDGSSLNDNTEVSKLLNKLSMFRYLSCSSKSSDHPTRQFLNAPPTINITSYYNSEPLGELILEINV